MSTPETVNVEVERVRMHFVELQYFRALFDWRRNVIEILCFASMLINNDNYYLRKIMPLAKDLVRSYENRVRRAKLARPLLKMGLKINNRSIYIISFNSLQVLD